MSDPDCELIAPQDLMIVAEKVSWQGLTHKWGFRWIAQVMTVDRKAKVYECPHGHPTKRDAMACVPAREVVELSSDKGK